MNPWAILRNTTTLIVVFVICSNCKAQCKITAPKTICIGDLGYFNISNPAGSSVASAAWDFGDGYTANVQNTGHLYAKTGKFTVRCKLILTGGGTCEDSLQLEVLKLPTADFSFKQRDTCFGKNKVCVRNRSTQATSLQPIIEKLVIWGDGSSSRIDSTGCYNYISISPYKLTFAVTDKMGCKHLKIAIVNIVPSLRAEFTAEGWA